MPNPDEQRAAAALIRVAETLSLGAEDIAALHSYDDADVSVGEALQVAVINRWRERGEQPGAWKIAWTSRAARDSGGAGYRPFGYIRQSRVFASGATVTLDATPAIALEPEICLVIGTELGGAEVTRDEARNAVRAVAPAFEIISRRLPTGLSRAVQVGDAMGNWGLVVGPEHASDLALDRLPVQVSRDGEVISAGTSEPDILDDPFLSLARACAIFAAHGLSLSPGQRVITGSILDRIPARPGESFTATFGELGTVSASLAGADQ
ncbi:MAG TPA: fumarylacetoacetate hydrolase family protein [Streptosporangiaceae bacterium]